MTQVGVGVFVVAIAVMFLCAMFLLGCRRYEEGITGNLGLSLLTIACAVVLYDAWKGELELPAPVYCLMILAAAIVLARHTYRFAMFHWHGHFGWSRPADMRRGPTSDIQ